MQKSTFQKLKQGLLLQGKFRNEELHRSFKKGGVDSDFSRLQSDTIHDNETRSWWIESHISRHEMVWIWKHCDPRRRFGVPGRRGQVLQRARQVRRLH
ncbi:hypothetical protein CEXT_631651 [Caerostris extrusa]|uniref:Uncharacterized protein n=1 Tax=Caerostris extrusa TaxID=172846 RepID=A0AAV4TAH6_CAEEX|nr:hypothetical protein CEXT_631651 [Caerostris extrusa]